MAQPTFEARRATGKWFLTIALPLLIKLYPFGSQPELPIPTPRPTYYTSIGLDLLVSISTEPVSGVLQKALVSPEMRSVADRNFSNSPSADRRNEIGLYRENAQTYRIAAGEEKQVLRLCRDLQAHLKSQTEANEQEILDLELKIEDWRRCPTCNQNKLEYWQEKLAAAYRWQALQLKLAGQLNRYKAKLEIFFDFVSNAQRNYVNCVRRLEAERRQHPKKHVQLQMDGLLAQAWELYSSLREIERAMEETTREIEEAESNRRPMYQLPYPTWSNIASMMLQLETTRVQSLFAPH